MIGTVSNILVILAILLTRQLRGICTAVLLISLSVTDVIICVVYQPMNIVDINYGSSAITETVRFRLGFGLFLASLNGELIVTLDRFISFVPRITTLIGRARNMWLYQRSVPSGSSQYYSPY